MADNTKLFSGLITSLSIAGSDIGGTGQVAMIGMDSETTELRTGQSHSKVSTILRSRSATLEIALVEFSVQNLAYALGQPSTSVVGTTYLNMSDSAPDEVVIILVVQNEVSGNTDTWKLPKCKLQGSSSITYNTEDQGELPLTFDIFPDTSGSLGFLVKSITA